VVLEGPTILTYEMLDKGLASHIRIPDEFWMAARRPAHQDRRQRRQRPDDRRLGRRHEVPPQTVGGSEMGIGETQFGPMALPSLIKENTKFMTSGT